MGNVAEDQTPQTIVDRVAHAAIRDVTPIKRGDIVFVCEGEPAKVLPALPALAAMMRIGGVDLVVEAIRILRLLPPEDVLVIALAPCAEGVQVFVASTPVTRMQRGGEA